MSTPGMTVIVTGRFYDTLPAGAVIMGKRGSSGAGWQVNIATWPDWQVTLSDGQTVRVGGGPAIPQGRSTLTAVFDRQAEEIRAGVDRTEFVTPAPGLADCSNALPVRFFANSDSAAGAHADMVFELARFYRVALSPSELRTVLASITRVLDFEGDSHTASGGATSMPNLVRLGLNAPVLSANHARGGETLARMKLEAPTQVDPHANGTDPVLVLWAGTNDLYEGATASSTLALMASYAEERRVAGWANLVVATCLPRTAPKQAPDYESERQWLNDGIRAASWYDALVDVGADARIGQHGNQLDPTYYGGDGTHLNEAGRRVVADLVLAALAPLGIR